MSEGEGGRRRYSDAERTEAVALAQRVGLTQAGRQLGTNRQTIWRWVQASGLPQRPPGAQWSRRVAAARVKAAAIREQLSAKMLARADELLDRMDEPHTDFKGNDGRIVTYPRAPAAAVQNYAISVGVLLDKYRLEQGEATSRSESRTGALGALDDHETTALRDAIKGELALRRAESAARRAGRGPAEARADEAPVGADAATEPGGPAG